jgi:hypothetical protein
MSKMVLGIVMTLFIGLAAHAERQKILVKQLYICLNNTAQAPAQFTEEITYGHHYLAYVYAWDNNGKKQVSLTNPRFLELLKTETKVGPDYVEYHSKWGFDYTRLIIDKKTKYPDVQIGPKSYRVVGGVAIFGNYSGDDASEHDVRCLYYPENDVL